jgi:hypothetical protein
MVPYHPSNRKDRFSGASLCLRLAQSASIEDLLDDFAKIAAETGICLWRQVYAGEAGARIRISNRRRCAREDQMNSQSTSRVGKPIWS